MAFLLTLARGMFAAMMVSGGGGAPRQAPAAAQPDTSQITAQMIAAGRGIFHGQGGCFVCHGGSLEGSPVAPPLNKKGKPWLAAKDGTFPEIFRVVTHGVPGTVMIAHPNGISDALATEVAAYIWAVNHHSVKP
ncbi:MAG: c-type cytochrome [Gemmatimonadaceae bacterium]